MYRLLSFTIACSMLTTMAGCGGPPVAAPAADCSASGFLSAELYGDLHTTLDWQGGNLGCESMPRPFGEGARLRFAGPARLDDSDVQLAFIVALPALEPGQTARELPATVTLMQENEGRFYSNRDIDICWSDVTRQDALEGEELYRIDGIVYCVAPLAQMNGDGSVTIRDLAYSGQVDWRRNDE